MDSVSTIKVKNHLKDELDKIDGKSYNDKISTILIEHQKNTTETSKVYRNITDKIDRLADKVNGVAELIERAVGK